MNNQKSMSSLINPTHLLTKYTYGIVHYSVWIKENPYFIEQTFFYDVFMDFSF